MRRRLDSLLTSAAGNEGDGGNDVNNERMNIWPQCDQAKGTSLPFGYSRVESLVFGREGKIIFRLITDFKGLEYDSIQKVDYVSVTPEAFNIK